MVSLMSTTKELCLWARHCWRTLRSTALLFQDAHEPHAIRAIDETESVFRQIADTEGNVVRGKHRLGWDESWPIVAATKTHDIVLLRGYVASYFYQRCYPLRSYRLSRGPSVDVFVGPDRAQFSVPKKLLLHYSKMARRTFDQHGGDKHFKEFEENALYFLSTRRKHLTLL